MAERVGFYTALILKGVVTYKVLTKLSSSIFGPYRKRNGTQGYLNHTVTHGAARGRHLRHLVASP
jgi:hypothetical protein